METIPSCDTVSKPVPTWWVQVRVPPKVPVQNTTREGPCRDFILIHKTFVHENAGDSTVEESHEGDQLLGVCGDYLNLEV
jgi:hypothetical protein